MQSCVHGPKMEFPELESDIDIEGIYFQGNLLQNMILIRKKNSFKRYKQECLEFSPIEEIQENLKKSKIMSGKFFSRAFRF